MTNFFVWIVVGGVIGWHGSISMHTEAERVTMFNIVVGAVGALTAELVLTPLLSAGSGHRSDFGLLGLMGAVALLAAVSGFRRLAQRYRLGE